MSVEIEKQVRPEIRSLLGNLRRRIRQHVMLETVARLLVLLGILFWLSFGMNWAYFKLSNLELAVWFRMAFGWLSIGGSLLFAVWLVTPMLRIMRAKALALILERRFPQLDDRLITAVEAADSRTGQETDLTTHMLKNTINDVSQAVDQIDVGEVFQRGPLKRSLASALMLVVSVAALAVVNVDAMKLWASAYIGYDEVYWDRQTTIIIKVVAQPNDVVKDFRDEEGNPAEGNPGTYKHPRGEDLVLIVEVPAGKNSKGNEWKVPEEIELSYTRADGRGSGSVTLRRKSDGDRQFRHSIGKLTDTIDALYIKGGDFANRHPYQVIVVDPPRIDRVVLECDYPDYTGYDAIDGEGNPVRDPRVMQGSQMSLPLETDFLLHAYANKPLVGVRLQSDEIEIALRPFREDQAGSAKLVIRKADGSRRSVDLPPVTAWRFRLIPAEMELHARFVKVVRSIENIQESKDAAGQIHRLSAASATGALEKLQELAKESAAIADSYKMLLENMDRKPLYPRLMLERIRAAVLVPLDEINSQQFPEVNGQVTALQAAGEKEAGQLEQTALARKGIDAMSSAMNSVLAEMSDGARFDVPLTMTGHAEQQLADESLSITGPIPLPADRPLRIYLEDIDDIVGVDPARLTVNGIVDQPPVVETRLRGISTAITRVASIPLTGIIRDDYGIVKSRFEFLVDAARDSEKEGEDKDGSSATDAKAGDASPDTDKDKVDEEVKWRIRPFRIRPEGNPLEFVLRRSPEDEYKAARFEVLPLDLRIGQELTLTVYAEDGDNINGPHITRGEKYRFKIVSNEELLSLLYGRELNIRRRFEQIIEEVKETEQDLILHRSRVAEADTLRAAGPDEGKEEEHKAKLKEIGDAVGNSAGRSFHQVSKNHSETRDVAQSFRELLEELKNNGVHTAEQVGRIEALIVKPLDGITKDDFPAVLTTVNLFKQAHEKGADPKPQIDESLDAIDTTLRHMRAVLAEMNDLVEFHEALKDLETIIKQQKKLEQETLEKQKKEAIEKLKRLGLD